METTCQFDNASVESAGCAGDTCRKVTYKKFHQKKYAICKVSLHFCISTVLVHKTKLLTRRQAPSGYSWNGKATNQKILATSSLKENMT